MSKISAVIEMYCFDSNRLTGVEVNKHYYMVTSQIILVEKNVMIKYIAQVV